MLDSCKFQQSSDIFKAQTLYLDQPYNLYFEVIARQRARCLALYLRTFPSLFGIYEQIG